MIDILSWVFLASGAFFMLVAGVGVLRMPDVFTRLHAAGIKDTLGAALTIIGLMLQAGLTLVAVKLALIWIFLWFTSPVASHSVARAALLGGVRPILQQTDGDGLESATESARLGDDQEGSSR
ncbi:MAG: sodium:proton antiporter [Gemmatimonas sp.]|nr:sodium:proton antiporter [Gemmatimonas sp.]